jgi:hypothetical protein
MPLRQRLRCWLVFMSTPAWVVACAPQLVAPYNSDLQQKASAMQAEVGSWDLAMRSAAGTAAADPRYPDVSASLDKWRGDADAMLTLAISDDPGVLKCGTAVQAVHQAILDALPADVRADLQANAPAANSGASAAGCEATLVAALPDEIEEIRAILTAGCKLSWVSDGWFSNFAQNRAAASKPPAPPRAADQGAVTNGCRFQFEPSTQTPPNAGGAGHGIAVSRLLRTLQEIGHHVAGG